MQILIALLIFLAPFCFTDVTRSEESEILTAGTVDQSSASFSEIQADPNAYHGRQFTLGGEVVSARRYEETTQIEILALPLSDKQEPLPTPSAASQGRFLAFQKNGLDPRSLPPHSRVTVMGEVVGSAIAEVNQQPYTYPVLEIKTLIIWTTGPEIFPPPPPPSAASDNAAQAPVQAEAPSSIPSSTYPAPYDSSAATVIERYYYTPYSDPFYSAWYWRPFWVYPWWIRPRPLVVVPRVIVPPVNAPPAPHFREHQMTRPPAAPPALPPQFRKMLPADPRPVLPRSQVVRPAPSPSAPSSTAAPPQFRGRSEPSQGMPIRPTGPPHISTPPPTAPPAHQAHGGSPGSGSRSGGSKRR